MPNNYEDLNNYFEHLSDKQIAYLELLETKHKTYRDNYNLMHQFNPFHRQNFIENHFGYLNGDEAAEFRRAIEYYSNAKYNSLGLFGTTLTLYSFYKIATTPKTSKISRFMLRGTIIGVFTAGFYMAYEHSRLTNTLGDLFVNIVQRKIKERTTSKRIN